MAVHRDEIDVLQSVRTPTLPMGVSAKLWQEERVRIQNPRIRAFWGAIEELEKARESNFVILHAPPARLRELLRQVQRVGRIVTEQLAPLIARPSTIPALEEARDSVGLYLRTLEGSVLAELARLPSDPPSHELGAIRPFLCVAIGKLHAFLVDSQSQLLAADPRSAHDAAHFLAKRFPRDVEDAEWLYASVVRLAAHSEEIEKGRAAALEPVMAAIRAERRLPGAADWRPVERFLDLVASDLVTRLREMLALGGIRVQEIEFIEGYVRQLGPEAALVQEVMARGRETLRLLPAEERDLHATIESAFAARLVELLGSIDRRIRDLGAFLGVWERGITQRRALFLEKNVAAKAKS